jgi:hypothetical protein
LTAFLPHRILDQIKALVNEALIGMVIPKTNAMMMYALKWIIVVAEMKTFPAHLTIHPLKLYMAHLIPPYLFQDFIKGVYQSL